VGLGARPGFCDRPRTSPWEYAGRARKICLVSAGITPTVEDKNAIIRDVANILRFSAQSTAPKELKPKEVIRTMPPSRDR
jgi:hypothetical protein